MVIEWHCNFPSCFQKTGARYANGQQDDQVIVIFWLGRGSVTIG